MTDSALGTSSAEHVGPLSAARISTPLKGSTRIRHDTSGESARAALEDGRFDQAPVVDHGGQVVGWVARRRLTQRVRRVEDVMVPLSTTPIVAEGAPIADVVELICSSGLIFVVGRGRLVAFISPSDLDRHASRGHFYLLVSQVEMQLARLVSAEVSDSTVKRHLSGVARTRYETAVRREQEVTLVEYLDLARLTNLVQKTEAFTRLGQEEQERVRSAISHVTAIRNAIMHPNAPLTGRNTAKLRDAQRAALYLVEALR